jgi:uroporphyrinogen decarboxylase
MTGERFLEKYDVDFRYIEGPRYIGPKLPPDTDIWGVKRSSVTNEVGETYNEVFDPPLAGANTVNEIQVYGHWPDADWFDYSVLESQCREAQRGERVVVFMGDRLNRVAQLKPAMYLRGAEEIFTDMAFYPDLAAAVFSRIKAFYLEYLSRILESARGKIDIVLTGDDFGAQNGLLISPDMWRRFIEPGFSGYLKLIKKHGAVSMHHTCGSVHRLIPDFVESGLDVLQSLQPEAAGMDLENLMELAGDGLCFQGGISIQRTMPFGTPADVRREVERAAAVARRKGGYIFCTSHNLQVDTPVDNIVALMEAYHEYGRTT